MSTFICCASVIRTHIEAYNRGIRLVILSLIQKTLFDLACNVDAQSKVLILLNGKAAFKEEYYATEIDPGKNRHYDPVFSTVGMQYARGSGADGHNYSSG